MSTKFKALVLREEKEGTISSGIEELVIDSLPEGEVLVAVSHSTLNYKDGMVIDGNKGGLVRHFPHIPGIDFAGKVLESADDRYKAGDEVILTGWRVGEAHWGGLSERARVKADWLVPMPKGMTAARAMAIGTAGFTAMLAIQTLEDSGLTSEQGKLLITGAAGGVGSVAIVLAHQLGYQVTASSGRIDSEGDYLKSLGANELIDRHELSEPTKVPLEKTLWAGCIDNVGGSTIGRVMGQINYGGAIAACGLAGGPAFNSTVLPLLLRSIKILGVDSVMQPYANRVKTWERITEVMPMDILDSLTEKTNLDNLPQKAKDILRGQVRGRLIVEI